jgi:hypothetical protein
MPALSWGLSTVAGLDWTGQEEAGLREILGELREEDGVSQ